MSRQTVQRLLLLSAFWVMLFLGALLAKDWLAAPLDRVVVAASERRAMAGNESDRSQALRSSVGSRFHMLALGLEAGWHCLGWGSVHRGSRAWSSAQSGTFRRHFSICTTGICRLGSRTALLACSPPCVSRSACWSLASCLGARLGDGRSRVDPFLQWAEQRQVHFCSKAPIGCKSAATSCPLAWRSRRPVSKTLYLASAKSRLVWNSWLCALSTSMLMRTPTW